VQCIWSHAAHILDDTVTLWLMGLVLTQSTFDMKMNV